MSGAAPSAGKGKAAKAKGGKKPFWQMELGRKKDADLVDEAVEHPPFVPTLPRVNLLPAAIGESIGLRKVRRSLIAVAVLIALLLGGVWYLQGSRISEAEARLAAAQAEGSQLQGQLDALAPITVLTNALADQKALVESTMAAQPQAAVVIERLREAGRQVGGGSGIAFSNASVSYQGIPAAGGVLNPCPNPDPFGTEVTIGCITFSASANDRQQVSRLLEVMEADPLFVGPYVTNTALGTTEGKQKTTVTFSGTAGVSVEGLKTVLTPEQVDAIVNPPAPAATTAPGGEAQ